MTPNNNDKRGIRISRKKCHKQNYETPQKHNDAKPQEYVSIYNKNNPELFAKIVLKSKILKGMTESKKY